VERLAVGPHAAARTEVIWTVLRQELARAGRPLAALDVGGGSGGFAVPLVKNGHQVTVVDTSPNSLAALTRRALDSGVADRLTAIQGDADNLQDLVPPESFDLALCHSLLEVVDDPTRVVAALAGCLRPGGAASVVVANRAAAVLARAVAGQLAAAVELLAEPAGPMGSGSRRAGPAERMLRRFDLSEATALLDAAGLRVERVHGVRVVADLVPGAVAEAEAEALVALETRLAAVSPYRDIATQFHLFARKPAE
jgi:SAM-dependent methyltransferase